MRVWLSAPLLFETRPDGTEELSAEGRARIDSAMSPYLRYVPSNPIVVEGFAMDGTAGERFRRSRLRAGIVREYVIGRFALTPQNTGYIGLGSDAAGSPGGNGWDGVSLTLFLDVEALQFATQAQN